MPTRLPKLLAPLHLTCVLFKFGVGLPTLGSAVCGLLWLFFGQCDCTLQGNKKKRRKKRKRVPTQKRFSHLKYSRKTFGPCRWIGGRRYKKRKLQWRLLGKFKWFRMLRHYLTQRVPTCPRQGCGADLGPNDRAKLRQVPVASLIQPVAWLCGWLGIRVGEASHPGPAGSRASKRKAETQRVVENPSRTVSLPLPCFRFFRISKVQLRMFFLSLPNPPIKSGKVGFPHLRKPVAPPLPEFFFKPFRRPLPITVLTRKLPPE